LIGCTTSSSSQSSNEKPSIRLLCPTVNPAIGILAATFWFRQKRLFTQKGCVVSFDKATIGRFWGVLAAQQKAALHPVWEFFEVKT
jgi:hypothetical protein